MHFWNLSTTYRETKTDNTKTLNDFTHQVFTVFMTLIAHIPKNLCVLCRFHKNKCLATIQKRLRTNMVKNHQAGR